MFGDFILDFEDNRIVGSKPKKIISSDNTAFADLPKALTEPAYGFISYDCCKYIENLPNRTKNDLDTPEFLFIVPEKISIRNIKAQRSNIQIKNKFKTQNSNLKKEEFKDIVKKAKEYIASGDIYQVNLSQRLETELRREPLALYQRLSRINPSPFASYFDLGDLKIVSCSPERLIKLENGIANTRPIAGTRPISAREEDLILNAKERAEHIMLVDLERNDLGRVCDYNSVSVDEKMVMG